MEAPPGFEPGNKGFADLCLTTWLWRRYLKTAVDTSSDITPLRLFMERDTRFELATFTLAR